MLGGAGDAVPGGAAAEGVDEGVVGDDLAVVEDDLAAGEVDPGGAGRDVADGASAQQLGDGGPVLGVPGGGLVLPDAVQDPLLGGDQGDLAALAGAGGGGEARVAGTQYDDLLLGHVVPLLRGAVGGVRSRRPRGGRGALSACSEGGRRSRSECDGDLRHTTGGVPAGLRWVSFSGLTTV